MRSDAEIPAQRPAKRAVDAAERHEGFVKRANCLAARHVPTDVAPDQETAQGHDEGRDRLISDQANR